MKTKFIQILTLALIAVFQVALAQQVVTGTVTDQDGMPLPGATIVIKGTSSAATADFDGNFSISAASGDVLVVSYVGYSNKQVKVNSDTIDISLSTNTLLDEVYVTGYGSQKKLELTGSVGKIDAELLDKVKNPNVLQAALGKVAGVQIFNNSGQPGAGPTVRIRGIGSLYASSSPLVVVDGIPFNGSINTLNPQDIQSITFLKDAASVSIYGSRGSNGVIIVTTKSAEVGNISASIDMSTSFSSRATKDYDRITNPGRYYEGFFMVSRNTLMHDLGYSDAAARATAAQNLITDSAGLGYSLAYNAFAGVPNDGLIDPATGLLSSNANTLLWNENWDDYLFDDNVSTKIFVNVSGGTENSKSYFSLGHEINDSYAINSDFTRTTATFKNEYNFKDIIDIKSTLNYARTVQNTPDQGGYAGAFSWTRSIAPIYPIFGYALDGTPILDGTGKHVYDFGDRSTGTPISRPYAGFANPYATSILDEKVFTTNNINATFNISAELVKNLKLRNVANILSRTTSGVNYDTSVGGDAFGVGGRSTPSASSIYTFNNQTFLEYKNVINKHSIDLLAGYEINDWKNVNLSAQKTRFLLPQENVLNQGITMEYMANSEFDYSVRGFLARLYYNFDEKYFFSANFRRDSSSVFDPSVRQGTFVGAGAAYRISKEDFFNVSFIDDLKIKASFGQVGNDRILYPGGGRNFLAYQDQYTVENNNGNFGLALAFQGNPALTWETSTNMNFGFLVGLFNNKMTVDFEYFERKVEDLLFNTPQPPSSGLPSFPENIGDMINRGFELTLQGEAYNSDDLNIALNFNISSFENEITKLPRDFIDAGAFRYEEGRSLYEYYYREFAGVNPANGAATFYKNVLDENGDPTGSRTVTETYSEADEYYTGMSPIPDFYGGFGTNINYKKFNLGINFAYSIGGHGRDTAYMSMLRSEPGENFHNDLFTKTWTPENTSAQYPIVVKNDDNTYYGTSTMYFIDNSYLSLQDISLSYDLTSIIKGDSLDNLVLYASADNVYLWSARQGYDPRTAGLTAFAAESDYSLLRNLSFGLKLTF
jgi:TonB-linked SusC/RagA family outer membrane protein